MGIPTSGCRDGGDGTRGCGSIRLPPPEHHQPLYFNLSGTGDMSGGETAAGRIGDTVVVLSGRYIHRPSVREDVRAGDGYRE